MGDAYSVFQTSTTDVSPPAELTSFIAHCRHSSSNNDGALAERAHPHVDVRETRTGNTTRNLSVKPAQLLNQHFLIKEQWRSGLILRRRRHIPLRRKVGRESGQ